MTELDKAILLCEKASLVLINEFEKFIKNSDEIDLKSLDRIAILGMTYHDILQRLMDNIEVTSKSK